jgi:hypothetical protein
VRGSTVTEMMNPERTWDSPASRYRESLVVRAPRAIDTSRAAHLRSEPERLDQALEASAELGPRSVSRPPKEPW